MYLSGVFAFLATNFNIGLIFKLFPEILTILTLFLVLNDCEIRDAIVFLKLLQFDGPAGGRMSCAI